MLIKAFNNIKNVTANKIHIKHDGKNIAETITAKASIITIQKLNTKKGACQWQVEQ